MLSWRHLINSTRPGRRGWTGATLAGWPTGQCSTPSPYPEWLVGDWVWRQGCATMGRDTNTFTAMTFSASPRLSKVSHLSFVNLFRFLIQCEEIWKVDLLKQIYYAFRFLCM